MSTQRTSPKLFTPLTGGKIGFGEHQKQGEIILTPWEDDASKMQSMPDKKHLLPYVAVGKRKPHTLEESTRRLRENYTDPFAHDVADLSYRNQRLIRKEFRIGIFHQVLPYLISHMCLINNTVGMHDNQNNFIYHSFTKIAKAIKTTVERVSRILAFLESRGYINTQVSRYFDREEDKWQNKTIIVVEEKLFTALHIDKNQLLKDRERACDKYLAIEGKFKAREMNVASIVARAIKKENRPKRKPRAYKHMDFKKPPVTNPGRGAEIRDAYQTLINLGHSPEDAIASIREKYPSH